MKNICFKCLVSSPVKYYRRAEPKILFVLKFYFLFISFVSENLEAEWALGKIQKSKCSRLFPSGWALIQFPSVSPMLCCKKKLGLKIKTWDCFTTDSCFLVKVPTLLWTGLNFCVTLGVSEMYSEFFKFNWYYMRKGMWSCLAWCLGIKDTQKTLLNIIKIII